MKKNVFLYAAALSVLGFSSCSDGEPSPTGELTLVASANTSSPNTGGSANARVASGITITDFKINIREVEFDFDDKDDDSGVDSVYKDIKLKGPFELDLIKDGTDVASTIGVAELPNAVYKEVEFKLHKSDVTGSDMYGKSIYIAGTIGNLPFVFWHDTDEEFEIQLNELKGMTIQGEEVKAAINFNLGYLFSEMSAIDFSAARDTDGDGVIEIDPDGADDNKDIAHDLKEALEDITDAIDDKD